MKRGDVISGKYRLARRLGEGAMGVVWAAVNESISREVALKLIIRPSEELRRRLLREAHACGRLLHRNIIDVYDVGETSEGDPFLVMPLLCGETLAARLTRRRILEPREAARIARDAARALAAAHEAGVIHRDLKPANIFLHNEHGSEEPVVKVLDFGVSKRLDIADGLSTTRGGIVGSPAYMSPEQALASRTVDRRADIWALGVVLFEMLTGTRPFQGEAHQIIVQICGARIPKVTSIVKDIDPTLVTLIERCLERDLGRRLASAGFIAAELSRYLQNDDPCESAPVTVRTTGSLLPKRKETIEPQSMDAIELITADIERDETCVTTLNLARQSAPPAGRELEIAAMRASRPSSTPDYYDARSAPPFEFAPLMPPARRYGRPLLEALPSWSISDPPRASEDAPNAGSVIPPAPPPARSATSSTAPLVQAQAQAAPPATSPTPSHSEAPVSRRRGLFITLTALTGGFISALLGAGAYSQLSAESSSQATATVVHASGGEPVPSASSKATKASTIVKGKGRSTREPDTAPPKHTKPSASSAPKPNTTSTPQTPSTSKPPSSPQATPTSTPPWMRPKERKLAPAWPKPTPSSYRDFVPWRSKKSN